MGTKLKRVASVSSQLPEKDIRATDPLRRFLSTIESFAKFRCSPFCNS
jgi:hypothetical protein